MSRMPTTVQMTPLLMFGPFSRDRRFDYPIGIG